MQIISFLSRPLSYSVRLFANMLAGHITLKVFAGFVALLGTSVGATGWIGGVVPLAMTVALTALALLVAFLQAYVFAMPTCIYLNDALHPGHQAAAPGPFNVLAEQLHDHGRAEHDDDLHQSLGGENPVESGHLKTLISMGSCVLGPAGRADNA